MDKEIGMICDMIEEIVLGSVADVPFMEEEGELIVTHVNGVKCCADVKTTDTLVDARAYIDEYIDFDLRGPQFLFQVASLLVDKCEEMNTPAWHLI
eukprot:12221405-Ditylum_brightwellii.AAC.1